MRENFVFGCVHPVATQIISGPCRNCCVFCDCCEPFHTSGTSLSTLHSWLPDEYATGKPFWVQDEGGFRKAFFEEWEQAAPAISLSQFPLDDQSQWHTSYCPKQHMSYHHDHTLSEQEELCACLTRADPQGEKREPLGSLWCAAASRRWMVHTVRFAANSTGASIFSAVVTAAPYKCKCGTEVLGFPPPCARTALPTSSAEAGHPRVHTSC